MAKRKKPPIGETIRTARHERGLSVAELAKKAGVDPVTIYGLEAGRRVPRAGTVSRLVRALSKVPKLPEL